MEDFTLPESRRRYYEENKEEFYGKLLKMWKIFWGRQFEDRTYSEEKAHKYSEDSLQKVWLSDRQFVSSKMPSREQLFQSAKWWFGQLACKENVTNVLKRELKKYKGFKLQLHLEDPASKSKHDGPPLIDTVPESSTKDILEKIEQREEERQFEQNIKNVFSKITEVVLALKNTSNATIIFAWLLADRKEPILKEVELAIPREYRCFEIKEECYMSEIKPREWTLYKVNAQFRFYLLWKKILNHVISSLNEELSRILESSYMSSCPERSFHCPDNDVAKKLAKKSTEIKNLRNFGASCALKNAYEDQNSEHDKLTDKVVDTISAQRIWKYSNRNIREGLRIDESICNEIRREGDEKQI